MNKNPNNSSIVMIQYVYITVGSSSGDHCFFTHKVKAMSVGNDMLIQYLMND